eukprot:235779-Lingulodinium_polyedra.AAC.1
MGQNGAYPGRPAATTLRIILSSSWRAGWPAPRAGAARRRGGSPTVDARAGAETLRPSGGPGMPAERG